MSKKFKTQDYFRYKRLGKRWRRPKGRQSKLRKKIAGSGLKPSIGRKQKAKVKPVLVKSIKDLEKLGKNSVVMLSSKIGKKKIIEIEKEAEKLGMKILNKKRIKKAKFFILKKQELKKKEAEKKKEVKAEKKEVSEKPKEKVLEEKKETAKEEKSKSPPTVKEGD